MIKKFLLLFLSFCIFPSVIYAKDIKILYIIKNTEPSAVLTELGQNFQNADLNTENNTLYFKKENFYYFRAYKADKNTELFVCSNDKNAESLIKNMSLKAYLYNDKSTYNTYDNDFAKFALQTGIKNKSANKNNNKLGYKNYNPYMGNLRNKVLETKTINQNNILIERKKLKAKGKMKHYTSEYVYNITNNTGKDIIIKKVASSDFIGLTQAAAYAAIPRGMDFVPIYGIVYAVQTDIEKNKFTRPHPINETIKAGDTMRILSLAKLQDNPVTDFIFIIDNEEVTIHF